MPQWLKENMFSNLILFSPAPLDYRKIGWNLPEFFRHFVDFSLYLLTGIYGTFPTCCSRTLPWHFLKKIRKLKSYIGGRLKRRSAIISSQKINFFKINCVGSRAGNSLICSFPSNQMSDCERFAQIAQDKWATVSELLRSLKTKILANKI